MGVVVEGAEGEIGTGDMEAGIVAEMGGMEGMGVTEVVAAVVAGDHATEGQIKHLVRLKSAYFKANWWLLSQDFKAQGTKCSGFGVALTQSCSRHLPSRHCWYFRHVRSILWPCVRVVQIIASFDS